MRALYDILGFICYGFAIYWSFFIDPNDYKSIFRRAMSNEVMNQQYAFLGAIVISLIGTGFIIMGSRHNADFTFTSLDSEDQEFMDEADRNH